jgi:hypothetical protein
MLLKSVYHVVAHHAHTRFTASPKKFAGGLQPERIELGGETYPPCAIAKNATCRNMLSNSFEVAASCSK